MKGKPLDVVGSENQVAANEGFAVRGPLEEFFRELVEDGEFMNHLRLPDFFRLYFVDRLKSFREDEDVGTSPKNGSSCR